MFGQTGASVEVADLIGQEAQRVADAIAAAGEAVAATCDVAEKAQVQAMAAEASSPFSAQATRREVPGGYPLGTCVTSTSEDTGQTSGSVTIPATLPLWYRTV